MESDGENIFEDYEAAENDTAADNTENAQTENSKEKVPVPKRIVKNPRLKFNPERLCGERGIPVLVDHFKDVKFKGPGYEREDLDKLMSRLEHWTHRLFPSMKFEDCLNQIEKLGKKRPVQTCLRKIRMDMPILSKDFVQGDEDDDVQRNDDPEPEEIDPFDRLVQESQDVVMTDTPATENVFSSNAFYSSPAPNVSVGHVLGSSSESTLSEEQKQRMERNRMLAAERRKARLEALKQNSLELQSRNLGENSLQNNMNSENTFDSLFKKSENSQTVNYSNDNAVDMEGDTHESALKKDAENSENLGLEDLIDLVDDEEPVLGKKSTQSVGVDKSRSENLGLEDLIDLVDDEESVLGKKSIQSNAVNKSLSENLELQGLIDLVDDEDPVIEKEVTSSDGADNSLILSVEGQFNAGKDSNIADDKSESPVLLIDEEPVVDKESTLSDDVNRSDALFIDERDVTLEKDDVPQNEISINSLSEEND